MLLLHRGRALARPNGASFTEMQVLRKQARATDRDALDRARP
jgi:hypothetical protein